MPIATVILLWALSAVPSWAEGFVCAGDPFATPVGVSAKSAGGKGNRVPAKGHVGVLVIYAGFSGQEAAAPPGWTRDLLDVNRVGSLSHFYHTMSFGELSVGGVVLPKRYFSPSTASSYIALDAGNLGEFGRFSVEILAQVDRDVDLRRYDNDGPDGLPDSGDDDGFVDYVFINVSSVPRGFLRGGATGIGGLGQDYASRDIGHDGNPIFVRGSTGYGAIQLEGSFTETVGVMAHEFGHGLGLPDLYDLDYTEPAEDSGGIGNWGLMGRGALGWNGGDGPNPLSPWSLEKLGWISVGNGRLIDADQDRTGLRLDPLRRGGKVLRVALGGGSEREYLLLEQRTRSGGYYDRALPGEGLLVWRVAPGAGNNALEHSKLVDVVCADGLFRDAGFPLGLRPDGQWGGDNLDYWSHNDAYRRAHGGNLGDARDLFDGDVITHLHMDGNPSTMPQRNASRAFTGLDLKLRREGEGMVIDLRIPRWAGRIGNEVVWSGQVWVDGDLVLAPEGRLSIEDGTRVSLAGTDRLRAGVDPGRVELQVQGSLKIIPRNGRKRVVFESIKPGTSWYGILLAPALDSEIDLGGSELDLSGALHGISFPRAPPGQQGRTRVRPRLIDVSGPRTAGNGDGVLNPGETFQVVLDLSNWSLETLDQLRGELRWVSSNVTAQSPFTRRAALTIPPIYPGIERTVAWPSLTLAGEAREGEQVGFSILVHGLDGGVQIEDLAFTVRGDYPVHSARLSAPSGVIENGFTVVPQRAATTIEAVIDGRVAGAELVARPVDDDLPVLELPMTATGGAGFHVEFTPPGAGAYVLHLRIRGDDGAVTFSDAHLDVWALPGERLPILAFFGRQYSTSTVERIAAVLRLQADVLGLDLHVIDHGDTPMTDYRGLMAYYGKRGGVVVWLDGLDFATGEAGLNEFLEAGGRLLLSANLNNPSSRERDFLSSMLRTDVTGYSRAAMRLHALFPLANVTFEVQHSRLGLVPPAEPILVDYQNRPSGLRLDTGVYRTIFLPFDMNYLRDGVLQDLFGPSLLFLEQDAVRASSLQVEGLEIQNQAVLVGSGQPLQLRVQIAGDATQAEVILSRGAPFFGERLGQVLLHHTRSSGEVREFQGIFQPPGPGRYRLALRSYDGAGNIVVTSSQLHVLVLDTEPEVLILRDSPHLGVSLGDASILDLDPSDWQVMDLLLAQYLDDGDAVVLLASTVTTRILEALRGFTQAGGRLLVVSGNLQQTTAGEEFLREVVGVDRFQRRAPARLHTQDLVPGSDLSMEASLARFAKLLAPAVPMAMSEEGRIAAVNRQAEGQHVIYLPFDGTHLELAEGRKFGQFALRHLLNTPTVDAGFAIRDQDVEAYHAMLKVDEATPIQARVSGAVKGVDLLVQSYDDVTEVTALPMRRRADGMYEIDFLPPAIGHYLLFLQLRVQGDTYLASTSIRVDALTFGDEQPVLVMIGDQWSAKWRDAVGRDIVEVLRRRGVGATIVVAPEDGPLFEALLDSYLDAGDVVIWMGRILLEEAQFALSSFLAKGGRLLMASADFRYSPGGLGFLREWLGIEDIGMGFPTRGQQFFGVGQPSLPIDARLEYAPMQTNGNGEVVLSEADGGIAGVSVTNGYRSVYLSFDMYHLDGPQRQALLEEQLEFLHGAAQAPGTEASLQIRSIDVTGVPVSRQDLAPTVSVHNPGGAASGVFRAAYEILLGDAVIASVTRDEADLRAGEERLITLPRWEGASSGDYRIRFAVSEQADSALSFGETQPLHIVAGLLPFEALDLPGAIALGNGAVLFDFDGDGDLDPYLVRRGGPDQLWRNDDGDFVQAAAGAGLDVDGDGRGVALGDADGDGDLDVYLVTEQRNRWFLNDGEGIFTDATSGSLADSSAGRSAAFFDADGDGDLDLYVVNAVGANRLFLLHEGRFTDQAARFGLADEGSGRGLAAGDIDDDGDTDLFLANRTGGSRLLRNDGGRFAAVEAAAGLNLWGGEVGAAFGDLDGDGRLDLFVAQEEGANRLFGNVGDGTFVDVALRDTLDLGRGAIGVAFLDADNDGDLDLMTTAVRPQSGGDQLFLSRHPYLLPVGGLLGLTPSTTGRGLSVGDVDGDGATDVFVADARRSRLYRNALAPGHWLRVRLHGNPSNRWGLGASVVVWSHGRAVVRQVQSALGYASQKQPILHFGLDGSAWVDSVVVLWPEGERTVRIGVSSGDLAIVIPREEATTVTGDVPLPPVLRLDSGYPNPFNASTTISYALPATGPARLRIFSINGQLVRRLVDGSEPAGTYRVRWEGVDDDGRQVASGVYFLLLEAAGQRRTARIMLIE